MGSYLTCEQIVGTAGFLSFFFDTANNLSLLAPSLVQPLLAEDLLVFTKASNSSL